MRFSLSSNEFYRLKYQDEKYSPFAANLLIRLNNSHVVEIHSLFVLGLVRQVVDERVSLLVLLVPERVGVDRICDGVYVRGDDFSVAAHPLDDGARVTIHRDFLVADQVRDSGGWGAAHARRAVDVDLLAVLDQVVQCFGCI